MENNDFIKIYTSRSIMEKAVIEEEFNYNNIIFYCSEDSALLLGHSTFHFYIKKEDSKKCTNILKALYINGELADDCESKKMFGI
ncbi:MAG: hypothetical protein V1874_00280 [Spirochaetota bacterium]